jgi:nucleotide-binding universal stress UspA family protein
MDRKGVVVINTAVEAGGTEFIPEFVDFCVSWLDRHTKTGVVNRVTLLYLVQSGDLVEAALHILSNAAEALRRQGAHVRSLVKVGTPERLAEEINSLKPEVVFLAEGRLSRRLKRSIVGLQVEYPNPWKKELRVSAAYGAAALLLYTAIFTSFGVIKGIITEKGLISVGIILGTVLAVAYLYGNTIAHALRYLGIRPKVH